MSERAQIGWRFLPPGEQARKAVPDWVQADPSSIQRALDDALLRPTGGWFVVDGSRVIGRRPRGYRIDGRELVVWRTSDGVLAAPAACPHMGASLVGARVRNDSLVCPWHGLALGREGHGDWRCMPAHDDGALVWVRLEGEEAPTERPILPPRPATGIDAVIRMEADCEPRDVIQNRLDPWHGGHFHPYSFGDLEVIEDTPERLVVVVEKRIVGPVRVAVEASFHCPDARTIVMTILRGEGEGSVVETHATPIGPGRSAIIELTLASSPRAGFRKALRLSRFIRPFMRRSARRLWVDDAAYAERLYALRAEGWTPSRSSHSSTRVLPGHAEAQSHGAHEKTEETGGMERAEAG